jgi:hypothetical protein
MSKSFRKLLSGTDGIVVVVVDDVQGWSGYWGSVVLVSKQTNMKGLTTMNTMINPEPQPTREELLNKVEELETRIEVLDAEIAGKATVLKMADESLQSYKAETRDWQNKHENLVESVTALAHEHLDLEGTEFFDGVVDLFNIELTKYVTYQYTVSIEVQAQVPAGMDEDDVIEELTNATLDYSFWGNGDIIIEGFDFGNMEVE